MANTATVSPEISKGSVLGVRMGFVMTGGRLQELPVDQIKPLLGQPRSYFDQAELEALASSMKANGQAQPILAVKLEPPDGQFRYQLVDGERRLRAAKLAGLPVLKAVLGIISNDRQHHLLSLISNFNRADHTHAEKTKAVFDMRSNGMTAVEIATAVGKSTGWVNSYVALSKLDAEILLKLDPPTPEGARLGFAVALSLSSVTSKEEQLRLYRQILEDKERGVSPVVIGQKVRRILSGGTIKRRSHVREGTPRLKKSSDDLKSFATLVPRMEAATMRLEDFANSIVLAYHEKYGYALTEKLMIDFRKCAKLLSDHAKMAEEALKRSRRGKA